MFRPIQVIFPASLMALTLSGCIGGIILYPAECKNETPTTTARLKVDEQKKYSSIVKGITKADFIRVWGKPDRINTIADNREIWIYERHGKWCGLVPFYLIPVPLVLPVCGEFEQLEFQGEEAKRLHIKRIVSKGGFIILPMMQGPTYWEPACRVPLPDSGVAHDAAESIPQASP